MRMPTPVDQLPSYNPGDNLSNQPGSNKWLPYIIVGGVVLLSIAAAIALTNNAKSYKLTDKKNKDE
jgi:hypothetical protein